MIESTICLSLLTLAGLAVAAFFFGRRVYRQRPEHEKANDNSFWSILFSEPTKHEAPTGSDKR